MKSWDNGMREENFLRKKYGDSLVSLEQLNRLEKNYCVNLVKGTVKSL